MVYYGVLRSTIVYYVLLRLYYGLLWAGMVYYALRWSCVSAKGWVGHVSTGRRRKASDGQQWPRIFQGGAEWPVFLDGWPNVGQTNFRIIPARVRIVAGFSWITWDAPGCPSLAKNGKGLPRMAKDDPGWSRIAQY